MTTRPDGGEIIMSDGSNTLRFIDPATFRTNRLLTVTADGMGVDMLNELEWVNGEILANVWMTSRIARIDPATGRIKGWIELAALLAKQAPPGRIRWPMASRGTRLANISMSRARNGR
jgi:glutaminyl-peptide cyclotransferase